MNADYAVAAASDAPARLQVVGSETGRTTARSPREQGTGPSRGTRVAVAADQRLVQETVVLGLEHLGARPRGLDPRPAPGQDSVRIQLSSMRAEVGLVIATLAVDDTLAELLWLIEQQPRLPWLVSCPQDPGAAAAPLAEAGATVIVGASLDRMRTLVDRLAEGDRPAEAPRGGAWDPDGVLDSARECWADLSDDHREAVRRLSGLTARQRDVLDALVRGADVEGTARGLGLAEATVRTVLKQVLRKLGVADRVKAVLLVEQLRAVPHL
ncbi:helix-turn-helix transcriptional regulator [Nocardioides bruguierae]|uniref:helix-turn-helix transcriptional regulator n=1 Tax=Nocardioides bruguierae TaxID=2945102 RepID=UPI00201FE546|nr:helix-turn-helix transcriptional regulator [Nocardioides bruguierae]MCL8027251.1 helix-turn-helix transcriptional regulator [Nocardioides bruguierae]